MLMMAKLCISRTATLITRMRKETFNVEALGLPEPLQHSCGDVEDMQAEKERDKERKRTGGRVEDIERAQVCLTSCPTSP